MGGQTPAGAGLERFPDLREAARRRFALVRLAVGVPAFVVAVFGLFLGYRLAELPLGDGRFWWVLGPVAGAFALYFGHAILCLRRRSPEERPAPPKPTEE